MEKKYQNSGGSSWKLLTFGALKLDKVFTKLAYTAVDLMSLFDKVLLHEV